MKRAPLHVISANSAAARKGNTGKYQQTLSIASGFEGVALFLPPQATGTDQERTQTASFNLFTP